MFSVLVPPAQLDCRCDQCRIRETHPLASELEVSPCSLQKLTCCLRKSLLRQYAKTYLELYIQRFRAEKMDHPCYPSLFFRQLLLLGYVWTSPTISSGRLTRSSVLLIFDQDATELENTVYVFW